MSDLKEQFDYDHWANRRLFTLTAGLPEPPEKARLLASHILNAQRIWISRIHEEESPLQVWEVLPLDKWTYWLDRNREDMRHILNQKQGNLVVQYRNSEGLTFRSSQSDILQHVLMHGAYHRGQIAQLIRPLTEVPYTDFIFYTREQMD
ncbi:MAG: DinB family protein [Saprospiraceae bacterium]